MLLQNVSAGIIFELNYRIISDKSNKHVAVMNISKHYIALYYIMVIHKHVIVMDMSKQCMCRPESEQTHLKTKALSASASQPIDEDHGQAPPSHS